MIYVNQVGYKKNGRKTAVVTRPGIYTLVGPGGMVIHRNAVSYGEDPLSGELCYCLDFSDRKETGRYFIKFSDNTDEEVQSEGRSCPFMIDEAVYQPLENALLKSFYYQRCGCALEEVHAGVYRHACCHTKEASVLGTDRKADVSGGWHDAGDYGRYTTAAAVSAAHLLWAWELYPHAFGEAINIPESGNGIPDILNEVRYELIWLLKLQQEDGGVCHKLTSMRHAYFVMPEADQKELLLFPVSSTATADFCAVMAQAAGAFADYDKVLADRALRASLRAWTWLERNPDLVMEKDPETCNTGAYDDECDTDERLWAATELFYMGKLEPEVVRSYFEEERRRAECFAVPSGDSLFAGMGWREVAGLAVFRILREEGRLLGGDLYELCRQAMIGEADRCLKIAEENAFGLAMGPEDFGWGSCMGVSNRGIVLAAAYRLCKDQRYAECCTNHLDYLLGKNSTGYSFVTGFGERAYENPHSRPCYADGIKEPIPGFVAGGPNSRPIDEKAEWLIEEGTAPMNCYLDLWECYSLNEITIYWNSSLLLMTAFLV
ncbi:MAG: glycoside hydrolase family 9 protein [Lachnospiraceae bacterium]